MEIALVTMEIKMEVPQKVENRANILTSYMTAIYDFKRCSVNAPQRCLHTCLSIVALFTVAKLLNQFRCLSTDESIKQWSIIHPCWHIICQQQKEFRGVNI